jgi:AbrB family looped-hinge helix DNA binding protein
MLVDFKTKSQVTIPSEIVKKFNLMPGDKLEVDINNCQIIITPVAIVPKDQLWFYSKKWQKMEKEVDEQIEKGQVKKVDNPEELFKNLGIEMTGKDLKKEMLKTGYSKAYANKHAKAYDEFLADSRRNQLTTW